MPYVLARNWTGQVLPPGARGYPRSHPNVFSYSRPRYFKGRGFRGLGQTAAGYTPGMGIAYGCTVQSVNACTFWDNFGTPSETCQAGIVACVAAVQAALASPAAGSTSGAPGTITLTTTGTGVQTNPACANAADPTSCTAALALQNASNQQISALTSAAGGTVTINPDTQSDSGIPTWAWYALAVLAGVVAIKALT